MTTFERRGRRLRETEFDGRLTTKRRDSRGVASKVVDNYNGEPATGGNGNSGGSSSSRSLPAWRTAAPPTASAADGVTRRSEVAAGSTTATDCGGGGVRNSATDSKINATHGASVSYSVIGGDESHGGSRKPCAVESSDANDLSSWSSTSVLLYVGLSVFCVVVAVALLIVGLRAASTAYRRRKKTSWSGKVPRDDASSKHTATVAVGGVDRAAFDQSCGCYGDGDPTSAPDGDEEELGGDSRGSFQRRLLVGVSAAVEAVSKHQKKRRKRNESGRKGDSSTGDDCLESATTSSSVSSSARHSIINTSSAVASSSAASAPLQVHRPGTGYSALSGTVYPAPSGNPIVNRRVVACGREAQSATATTAVPQSYQLQQPPLDVDAAGGSSAGPYGASCSYFRPTHVSYVTLHRSQTVESEGVGSASLDLDASAGCGLTVNVSTPVAADELAAGSSVLDPPPLTTNAPPARTLRSLFGVVEDVLGVYGRIFSDDDNLKKSNHSKKPAPAPVPPPAAAVDDKEVSVARDGKVETQGRGKSKSRNPTSGGGVDTVRAILGSLSVVSGPLYGSRSPRSSVGNMGATTSSNEAVQSSPLPSTSTNATAAPPGGGPSAASSDGDFVRVEPCGSAGGGSETVGREPHQIPGRPASSASSVVTVQDPSSGEAEPSSRRQSAGGAGADSSGNSPCISGRRQSVQQTAGSPSARDRISELADAIGLTGLMRTVTGNGGTGTGSSAGHSPTGIGVGPAPASAITASREEQFWVPPNVVVQKKRAHSLQSAQQLIVAGVYQAPAGPGCDIRNGE
jgi:hypothetical protein